MNYAKTEILRKRANSVTWFKIPWWVENCGCWWCWRYLLSSDVSGMPLCCRTPYQCTDLDSMHSASNHSSVKLSSANCLQVGIAFGEWIIFSLSFSHAACLPLVTSVTFAYHCNPLKIPKSTKLGIFGMQKKTKCIKLGFSKTMFFQTIKQPLFEPNI